jgi:hypothetical protein
VITIISTDPATTSATALNKSNRFITVSFCPSDA